MAVIFVDGDGDRIEIDPEALEEMDRGHEEYEKRLQEAIDEEWNDLWLALDDEELLAEDSGEDS